VENSEEFKGTLMDSLQVAMGVNASASGQRGAVLISTGKTERNLENFQHYMKLTV
jgi:hypothetical protein